MTKWPEQKWTDAHREEWRAALRDQTPAEATGSAQVTATDVQPHAMGLAIRWMCFCVIVPLHLVRAALQALDDLNK